MENQSPKPKKRGTAAFTGNYLTNEDDKNYHMGRSILMLWKKCDGNKTIDELAELMSEEQIDLPENEHTSTVIKEILDILEEKKLISYMKCKGS
ncbi:MAG: PqqD family peptide modification chaperone [Candidatus Altiarchaeota archaeon]|nr:PqqD family peptide modification chaperone [Candidatus Altiarchaeota archaeon]